MEEKDFIKNIDLEKDLFSIVFNFANGARVMIHKNLQRWEYVHEDDSSSYRSGHYLLDDDTVIYYDGCLILPIEVMFALGKFYKLDL